MALIIWTEEQFGTKVGFADNEHKDIFTSLNNLYDLAIGGADRSAIGAELDKLINIVVAHFLHEEREMLAKGFAGLDKHKAEHDALVGTCADLQKQFYASQADVTEEVGQMVKGWLENHIPTFDFAYSETLNS